MLKIEHLNLSFGGLKATNDICMHVKPNQITALIGPNGAGKTTLFNQITGVYKPDSGQIWFNGVRIDGKKPYQINDAGISRTYQVINLFRKMSVLENVQVGMHTRLKSNYWKNLIHTKSMRIEEAASLERAYELLDFVGLTEHAKDQAGSLSYGKQRLLEIIRGMANDPKLILLDEPAAGMNSAEKEDLNVLIRRIIDRGITVLVVEHDMKLVMDVADEIYVIESGTNLANGTPKEIQSHPEVIRAYLGGDD
ncbi:ABC transporter ATP-binding protein [Dysosmobacter sp. Marseille-Q4140]|nr:ABC transporter ATP-binding protein [Dysosmobacter sp. Marseille-Q4140]